MHKKKRKGGNNGSQKEETEKRSETGGEDSKKQHDSRFEMRVEYGDRLHSANGWAVRNSEPNYIDTWLQTTSNTSPRNHTAKPVATGRSILVCCAADRNYVTTTRRAGLWDTGKPRKLLHALAFVCPWHFCSRFIPRILRLRLKMTSCGDAPLSP
jgi:hypothetical protein